MEIFSSKLSRANTKPLWILITNFSDFQWIIIPVLIFLSYTTGPSRLVSFIHTSGWFKQTQYLWGLKWGSQGTQITLCREQGMGNCPIPKVPFAVSISHCCSQNEVTQCGWANPAARGCSGKTSSSHISLPTFLASSSCFSPHMPDLPTLWYLKKPI